jgi:hypothetical protein
VALSDTIRGGVLTAHQIVGGGGLEENVTLYRWKAQDAYAQPVYATAFATTAVVEHSRRLVRAPGGEEQVATAILTFIDPIPALSPTVTGRKEPIDERDKIVLANGHTGAILRTDSGLLDPTTTRPYLVQVWMG